MIASSYLFGFLSNDTHLQKFRSSDNERDNFDMLDNRIDPPNSSSFYDLQCTKLKVWHMIAKLAHGVVTAS
jgi:hypothetical protein